jgi:hypothetical protein
MATTTLSQFVYPPNNNNLEVVIITNTPNDCDGYLELNAATKLLVPFSGNALATTVWSNAAPSHKLTKNNKNYLHVFALFKYLASYNLNNARLSHVAEYYILKTIIGDLLAGVQSKSFGGNGGGSGGGVFSGGNDHTTFITTANNNLDNVKNQLEALQKNVSSLERKIVDAQQSCSAVLTENLHNLHTQCINKMTFNTETILENVKSIKDLVCLAK